MIKIGLPVVLDSLGMTAQPFLMDGNIAVISFFITGLYPGALWMAYVKDIKSPVLRRYARMASSAAKGAVTEM